MLEPLLKIGDEVKALDGNWHKINGYTKRFCGHLGDVPCYKLNSGYTWPIETCDKYIQSNPSLLKRKN